MDLGQALQQLGQLLSWSGGPVNWDLAMNAARHAATAGGDPVVAASQRRAVEDAVRLADLWLDEATVFGSVTSSVRAWSRAEWLEGTLPAWRGLVEPVAERVGAAMEQAVPPEAASMAGPLLGVVRQIGVSVWGAQVGQGLGSLSGEVVGSTDVGLPLTEPGRVVLVPRNIAAFGSGLGLDEQDVLVYLALREVARHRLFARAPWLRAHLVALVEQFARGITINVGRIEETVRGLDPTRPEQLQEAFESGLFDLQHTPEQQAALDRLEAALALVEGWTDDVVTMATDGRLGSAGALRETVRRQRATGGPAEQTFATLVGLELRPRRLRDAATLFGALRAARGIDGRDQVWAHPDLMPDVADLDDPLGYSERHDDLLAITDMDPGGPSAGADEPGDAPPEPERRGD
jgi:putative hydrolase